MAAGEIHFRGDSVTGNESGSSRTEMLSLALKSQQLLLISSHSFFQQLRWGARYSSALGIKKPALQLEKRLGGLGRVQGAWVRSASPSDSHTKWEPGFRF